MFEDFIFDWVIPITIAGIFLIGVPLLIIVLIQDGKHKQELYNKCLQDHKDYECYALIYKEEHHVTPVPVIIPMGR